MVKAKRDIVNALVLIAFAAGYFWVSQDIPTGDRAYGPAFMPVLVSFAIGALALLLLVTSIVRVTRQKEEQLVLDPRQLFRENEKIVYIFLATGLYILGISQLGYLVSTPIFMVLVYYIVVRSWNRRSWQVVAGYVIFTLLIYLVFEQFLQIPLPQGLL